jgi:hypothetical protein
MTDQQLPSDAPSAGEPTMELLGGDATAASAAGPSLVMKLVRGTLFGVVLLTTSALLAVSAVPELGRYLTFGSAGDSASCALSASACTTLDKVNFDSPCCATQAVAASAEGSACCPLSAGACTEAVAAGDEAAGSCCATLSRAALLTASADKPACCESSEKCCPAAVAAEEPIDAGSLLAIGDEQVELAPVDQIEE